MKEITPPVPLDDFPATAAVWNAVTGIQAPLVAMQRLMKSENFHGRFRIVCNPENPDTGYLPLKTIRSQISAHKTLQYHSDMQAFDISWEALCDALTSHPSNQGKGQFLTLFADAKSPIGTGEHLLNSHTIEWQPGKADTLRPFLSRLIQYEKLNAVTPEGNLNHYILTYSPHSTVLSTRTRKRTQQSYTTCVGVDVAVAALHSLIANPEMVFLGAAHYDPITAAHTPEEGEAPEGEENWQDIARDRIRKAHLPLTLKWTIPSS